ncbi:hypothetical protein B0H16DRAFT_1233805, partial [Mycena metata]
PGPTPPLHLPPTPCDLLTADTINAAETDEEATLKLYGTVPSPSSKRIMVYLASTCRNSGKPDARAAFGTYWGYNSQYNVGWRIPERQTEGRAVLAAILYSLRQVGAKGDKSMDIFTTSKFAIRAICYAAGKNYTRGWDCTNGDLLEAIAKAIRAR